jgi:hypothetical protein
MSTDDENEKQSLDDAIERLEAEHRRRIDEKVERGEAVRVTLDPVVVGLPDSAAGYIAWQRKDKLAELRAAGEKREVIFEWLNTDASGEPIEAIITGVPRRGRDVPIDAPPGAKKIGVSDTPISPARPRLVVGPDAAANHGGERAR